MKGKLIAALFLPFFIFFMTFLPAFAMAQGPGGPGGGGDPACDPQCNCRPDGSICPIDSNVYIFLAIGVFYGIKKVKDSRKPSAN